MVKIQTLIVLREQPRQSTNEVPIFIYHLEKVPLFPLQEGRNILEGGKATAYPLLFISNICCVGQKGLGRVNQAQLGQQDRCGDEPQLDFVSFTFRQEE